MEKAHLFSGTEATRPSPAGLPLSGSSPPPKSGTRERYQSSISIALSFSFFFLAWPRSPSPPLSQRAATPTGGAPMPARPIGGMAQRHDPTCRRTGPTHNVKAQKKTQLGPSLNIKKLRRP